ncbi:hypothetical protein INH39_17485 [Massilia violaceinigra]|uniref:Lipoprotein n=1 Tax=Massilia violaceinigra TaxID=2045208 RepID=A0ABY3ZY97_9BURK|nr:hypothetical protein [Massilia violaceinigra]UOD27327.1 hypothetical protein INH39_17485 [Massilia violaceinigra]
MNITHCPNLLLAILLASNFMIGCTNDKNPNNPVLSNLVTPEDRESYELIKVQRPTSIDEYFKVFRWPYEMCVALADLKKLPVKPFSPIPKDFVLTRTTVTSDGKSFRTKEEGFGVNLDGMSPENGCETKFQSSSHSWVEHNGFQSVLGPDATENDEDGPVEIQMMPYSGSAAASYPISKKINGISVKCTDGGDLLVAAKAVDEICILDPAMGRIAMADGKPPVVYMREAPGTSMYGTVMVHEPISLKIGIKVNSEIFVNENAK